MYITVKIGDHQSKSSNGGSLLRGPQRLHPRDLLCDSCYVSSRFKLSPLSKSGLVTSCSLGTSRLHQENIIQRFKQRRHMAPGQPQKLGPYGHLVYFYTSMFFPSQTVRSSWPNLVLILCAGACLSHPQCWQHSHHHQSSCRSRFANL